MEIIV